MNKLDEKDEQQQSFWVIRKKSGVLDRELCFNGSEQLKRLVLYESSQQASYRARYGDRIVQVVVTVKATLDEGEI